MPVAQSTFDKALAQLALFRAIFSLLFCLFSTSRRSTPWDYALAVAWPLKLVPVSSFTIRFKFRAIVVK